MFSKLSARGIATRISYLAQKTAAQETSSSSGSLSEAVYARENKYGAHNYHPLPVAKFKLIKTKLLDLYNIRTLLKKSLWSIIKTI